MYNTKPQKGLETGWVIKARKCKGRGKKFSQGLMRFHLLFTVLIDNQVLQRFVPHMGLYTGFALKNESLSLIHRKYSRKHFTMDLPLGEPWSISSDNPVSNLFLLRERILYKF